MRHILATTLAVVLLAGAAGAQNVLVKGTLNCALWSSGRLNKDSTALEHYLQGLINGLALGSRRDFWSFPYSIEPDQAFYWMDKYCAEAPLSNVVGGVYTLFEERFGKGWALQ
jgi:hypothetical protein